eukprot:2922286-Rhodomonas_salina.2
MSPPSLHRSIPDLSTAQRARALSQYHMHCAHVPYLSTISCLSTALRPPYPFSVLHTAHVPSLSTMSYLSTAHRSRDPISVLHCARHTPPYPTAVLHCAHTALSEAISVPHTAAHPPILVHCTLAPLPYPSTARRPHYPTPVHCTLAPLLSTPCSGNVREKQLSGTICTGKALYCI